MATVVFDARTPSHWITLQQLVAIGQLDLDETILIIRSCVFDRELYSEAEFKAVIKYNGGLDQYSLSLKVLYRVWRYAACCHVSSIFVPVNWGFFYVVLKKIFGDASIFLFEDGTGSFLRYDSLSLSIPQRCLSFLGKIDLSERGFLAANDALIVSRASQLLGLYNKVPHIQLPSYSSWMSSKSGISGGDIQNDVFRVLLISNQDYELGRVTFDGLKRWLASVVRSVEKVNAGGEKKCIMVSLHHQEDLAFKTAFYKKALGDIEIVPPSIAAEEIAFREDVSCIVSPFNSTAMYVAMECGAEKTLILIRSEMAYFAQKKLLFLDISRFSKVNLIYEG